jgi:hypothetical protein
MGIGFGALKICGISSYVQAYSRLHIMKVTVFSVVLEDNQVLVVVAISSEEQVTSSHNVCC